MSQRGVTPDLLTLALEYGEPMDDGKIVIGVRALDQLMNELQSLKKAAQKAKEKGGIVVVEEEGHLLTTYPLNARFRKSRSVFKGDFQ